MLPRFGRAIGFVQRGLPLAEVPFLGQFAFGAQLVEQSRVGRALIEEAGVEVENPFGYNFNDLPLEAICSEIERDAVTLAEIPRATPQAGAR